MTHSVCKKRRKPSPPLPYRTGTAGERACARRACQTPPVHAARSSAKRHVGTAGYICRGRRHKGICAGHGQPVRGEGGASFQLPPSPPERKAYPFMHTAGRALLFVSTGGQTRIPAPHALRSLFCMPYPAPDGESASAHTVRHFPSAALLRFPCRTENAEAPAVPSVPAANTLRCACTKHGRAFFQDSGRP